jgi:intracellular sulfur oxidation DsrE/DsrF family protein
MLAFVSSVSQAADNHDNKAVAGRAKVVFQVSDDDAKKWNLTLNNVKNMQQDLGAANVEIEVVAYGPGINMFKFESTVAERIDEAIKSGVKIVACENSMKALKLVKSDMMASIGYVPAGVTEIIKREYEGFAYIRP